LASSPSPERSGPAGQLHELRQQLRGENPNLYRHLALYLQVLRQVLPVRVERASFHIAAQLQPRRYSTLPAEDRRQLHRRVSGLVLRCNSLLTVEQLASLASQMARERQRQERRQRQQLVQRLSSSAGEEEVGSLLAPFPGTLPPPGSPSSSSASEPAGPPLPEGSVNLDGSLPFSAGLFRVLTPPGEPPASVASFPLPWELGGDPEEAEELDDDDDDGERGRPPGQDLPPFLQRLMEEALTPPDRQAEPAHDPWSGGQLPDDPLSLLRWLDGIEAALTRRLRNLSHAINVELLRVGLSGCLLPVSLLDAVLAGQLEPQPAPPNLLRLKLPIPADDTSPLQVMAVLLRHVDLELEEPRLRTCRRRLQQHRQEVRRMAHQFHRLQRRREAHEAEQLWLQDRHQSQSPPG
jgi:hypothetical protein